MPENNESFIPVVVNVADDPNLLSVTSVGPLPESADQLQTEAPKEVREEEVTAGDANKEKENPSAPEEKPTDEPEPEPKKDEDGEPPQEPEKPKEKRDKVQERIDKAVRQYRDEERAKHKALRELGDERQERQRLEDEVARLRKSVPAPDKPKREDFEDDAEFIESLTDWKIGEAARAKAETETKSTNKDAREQEIDNAYDSLDEALLRGRDKHDDFEDTVRNNGIIITEGMVQAALATDTPEEILYYLGKHPEESAAISKLNPQQVAYQFGKIEAKLQAPPPIPKPKPSKAPEPIAPIKTAVVTEKSLESAGTLKEYEALRKGGKS